MTLFELYSMIEGQLRIRPSKMDDKVCIKTFGSSFGGQTVTPVKSAGCGIDWDNGKFIVYPETELAVKAKYYPFGQEPNQSYCESCANFPCEATKAAMFCEGKNWREK